MVKNILYLKNLNVLTRKPGVGKSSLTEGLAIAVEIREVPTKIKSHTSSKKKKNRFHKIFEIDISAVVAGSKWRGQFEERMKKIIAISRTPAKMILVIDEIF